MKTYLLYITTSGKDIILTGMDDTDAENILIRLAYQLPKEYQLSGGSLIIKNYQPGKVWNHIQQYCNPEVISVMNFIDNVDDSKTFIVSNNGRLVPRKNRFIAVQSVTPSYHAPTAFSTEPIPIKCSDGSVRSYRYPSVPSDKANLMKFVIIWEDFIRDYKARNTELLRRNTQEAADFKYYLTCCENSVAYAKDRIETLDNVKRLSKLAQSHR